MPAFKTPEPISVAIDLPVGTVHLIAGDRADTVVVVNPTDDSQKLDLEAAERTSIDLSNGRLVIKTPKTRGLGSLIGTTMPGSVDMTIELPRGSKVDADIGFADLQADGRLGDIRVRNGAGNIRLDEVGSANLSSGAGRVVVNRIDGAAEVTTASEMQIGGIGGDAELKNLNGKTWLGEVIGRLQVNSANGDITVDRAHCEVAAKTANGSIQIGEVMAGTVSLETGSGGLDIGIPEGVTAWVDASTRFGRVHNSLGAADGPTNSQAKVEVRARTSFGDVGIHRSHLRGEQ